MARGPYAIRAVRGLHFVVEYHDGYLAFVARQWAYWFLDFKVEAWREDN